MTLAQGQAADWWRNHPNREEMTQLDQMSIGEFAGQSRLSPKALRLYDELGLLTPARVDESSGYRYYAADQLERARLIAALRQLQIPLAQIKEIVGLEPAAAAERVRAFWMQAEDDHASRRRLARHLVDRLSGKRPTMYDVDTRTVPERTVLCLKRAVPGEAAAWALGKGFIALMRERQLPRLEGRAGAVFCIYWSEVSEDSDGPVEWCRPVPADQAEALAATVPELVLRTEPAHDEAFVRLGPAGQTTAAQWQLVSDSLRAWAEEHRAIPIDLGLRITYLASMPATKQSVADCDFAVPFAAASI